MNTLNEYNKYLKKYFGYDKLKDKQFEIIDAIISQKKDVCAILPTGYGKSICYQLPFLILQKTVFIVSPLISLMEDQMQSVIQCNIPAVCLNSTTDYKNKIEESLLNGDHKIVYITPERLVNSKKIIKNMAKKNYIGLFAIDEAHCISEWGADKSFRPDYRKLKKIKKWTKNIPILSLTATADDIIKQDICNSLKLSDPVIIKGNLLRNNLTIHINKKNNIDIDILPLLQKFIDITYGSCIIYAKTRDECDNIYNIINNKGYNCGVYHAGMDSQDRLFTQTKFIKNEINIIVATIAFAMGIDKQNIRLVCHYGCPANMVSYYQEIGRAGRDGKESDCIMFYSDNDFRISRYFLSQEIDENFIKYKENNISYIEKFVNLDKCRWKIVLEYFGEQLDSCGKCDVCINGLVDNKIDLSEPAFLFFSLLSKLNDKYGTITLINILRGSKSKKITVFMKKLVEYGSGIHYCTKWWKMFLKILINEGYIRERRLNTKFSTVIRFTNKGIKWFNKAKKNHSFSYSSNGNIFDSLIEIDNKLILSVNSEFINLFPTHINNNTINDLDNQFKLKTLTMFNEQKLSISDISKIRKINESIITSHILELMCSHKINLKINKENYNEIINMIKQQKNFNDIAKIYNVELIDILIIQNIMLNNLEKMYQLK